MKFGEYLYLQCNSKKKYFQRGVDFLITAAENARELIGVVRCGGRNLKRTGVAEKARKYGSDNSSAVV